VVQGTLRCQIGVLPLHRTTYSSIQIPTFNFQEDVAAVVAEVVECEVECLAWSLQAPILEPVPCKFFLTTNE
jgi:hypothetical protein